MPNKIPELSNFIPHLKDSVKIRKTKGSQKKKGNWGKHNWDERREENMTEKQTTVKKKMLQSRDRGLACL